MSGKRNNRLLLGVFLVLAALLVITRFTKVKKSERTLAVDIVRIDTSQVTSILLYPAAEPGAELEFERLGASWTVALNDLKANADPAAVQAALAALLDLKPEQLVARSPEHWTEYQVDDSLGTRVIVKEGQKNALDLVVGRFTYQQPDRNSYDPYNQNRVSGKTYVRLSDEDEVYSVEGFLALSINQPFERWRDHTVTNLNTSRLSRIAFDYPADSGFIAEKTEAGWLVAGIMADSSSMAKYINGVRRKSNEEFEDRLRPGGEPDFQVSFEGDNMQPQQVRAFIMEDGQLILNSSVNPDSWFRIPAEGLFNDLFPGTERLISGGS